MLLELSPKKAVINDSNQELINVYNVLCDEDKFKKLCSVLNSYEVNHSEEFYYEIKIGTKHFTIDCLIIQEQQELFV